MDAFRAGNLSGQAEFIDRDASTRWHGPLTGGHYWPELIRTADSRLLVACLTRDGYASRPGLPPLAEVTANDAAGWFEANKIAIPPELIADLQERSTYVATPNH